LDLKEERCSSEKIYRGVEQLVARWAHNPKVTGSSPVPATIHSIGEQTVLAWFVQPNPILRAIFETLGVVVSFQLDYF
jgi:hypothetical protein